MPAQITQYLPKNLDFHIGNLSFAPSYLQAGAIIVLIFLLIVSMAQFRRHLLSWSVKGAVFGIFFGFLLALIMEGFLIIGGKTALTEVLGWKNAPKPIQTALDIGRSKLTNVLGVKDEIPASTAKENASHEDVIRGFQSLSPAEAKKAKSAICQP